MVVAESDASNEPARPNLPAAVHVRFPGATTRSAGRHPETVTTEPATQSTVPTLLAISKNQLVTENFYEHSRLQKNALF